MHNMKGIHHRLDLEQDLFRGGDIASEPVHHHDFDGVAEALFTRLVRRATLGGHVQQPDWLGVSHNRGDIYAHSDKRALFPYFGGCASIRAH